MDDVFVFLDSLNPKIKDFTFAFWNYPVKVRKFIKRGVWFALLCWCVMGFDSGVGMIEYPVQHLPDLLTGKMDWVQWSGLYEWVYGKSMHWSAFVIYGLLYIEISNYLEFELDMTNSRNFVYSFAFTLFNIGLFEWFWMYSYATFQNQPWVLGWNFPQGRIMIQNTGFTVAGALVLLYFYLDSFKLDYHGNVVGRLYKFRPSPKLIIAILITLMSAYFWIEYPLYSEPVTTNILGQGLWTSTPQFPQTVYTVDLDLTDTVNAGVWFFVENDKIHFVNTGVKALWAYVSVAFVQSWRKVYED